MLKTKISSVRCAVIFGSFCRSDPAAALRGFLNGFSSKSSCRSHSRKKLSSDIYTSPRTSKNGSGSLSVFGTDLIVPIFSVTSSPVMPSPRVEPRVYTPFTYSSATERPSNFGSTTYTGSSTTARTRRSKSRSSSSENESCRLSIGTVCVTSANVLYPAAPTRFVGESSVFSSGNDASRFSKRRYSMSYA